MVVRCLTNRKIHEIYKGRKVNQNVRWGIKPGYDYIVISIAVVIELEKGTDTSIQYWIINEEKRLLPYDAFNFKIIDSSFPASWFMDLDERGICISHPKWAQYGYVEDYFDDIKVEKEYNKIVKVIFDESIEAASKKGIKLNLGIEKIWTPRLSD